jgi:CDP-diglyceride synthetase
MITTRDALAYLSVAVFILLFVMLLFFPRDSIYHDIILMMMTVAATCMKDTYGYFFGSSKEADKS